jgi:hypothetical protein
MHAAFLSPILHVNYSSLFSKTTSYLYNLIASQDLYAHIWTGSIITATLGGVVYGTEVWRPLVRRGDAKRNETYGRDDRGGKDEESTVWEDLEGDTDVER